ncbi:repeat domain (List_Bact_rpt) [Lachnospiraceae bacterium]|nr:repeat domain (List_Bact_rpt) [Lachnospiraceae bacterium]
MRYRFYKKMIAYLLAASMVLSGVVPAYAAEEIRDDSAVETAGEIDSDSEEIVIDEEDNDADPDAFSGEESAAIDEEDEQGEVVSSFRSSFSGINALGAGIDQVVGTVSQADPGIKGGVYWWFTDETNTILCISANESATNAGVITSMTWEPGQDKGEGAWLNDYADSIQEVQFYGEIKEIGNYAFAGCSNLITIQIPKSCTRIGRAPFVNCTKLASISVEANGNFATDPADSGQRIIYTSDYKELVCAAGRYNDGLTILDGTERIADYAFINCSGITGEIDIPHTVQTIGEKAFYGCSKVTQIKVGNDRTETKSLTEIKSLAFYGCKSVKKIFLPNTLKNGKVKTDAFEACSGVKYIIYYGNSSGDTESSLRTQFASSGITKPAGSAEICYCPYSYWVVFFNPGNGVIPNTVSAIAPGGTFGNKLPIPEYQGKEFAKWYYSNDETSEFTGTTAVIADTDLTAVYSTYYVLKFVSQDGADPVEIKVLGGKTLADYVDKIPQDPVSDTGTFKGWKSKIKRTIFNRTASTGISEYSSYGTILQNDTFTAQYTSHHLVKFYAEDGTLLDSEYFAPGTKISDLSSRTYPYLEEHYPADHYEKIGWYINNGSVKFSEYTSVYSDQNLYVKFRRFILVSYNFGYPYNGTDLVKTIKHTYNTDLNIAVANDRPQDVINGEPVAYEFQGWYDKAGNLYATQIPKARKDLELFAKWLPRFKVTFYKFNTDTEPYAVTDFITSENKIYLQMPDAPKLADHAFRGWYTADGEKVTGAYVVTKPVKAYARFQQGYFNIYYYSGNDQVDTQAVLSGDTILNGTGVGVPTQQTLADIGFTKRGYKLIGWNTEPDGSGIDITDDYIVTGDVTCYAQWYDDPDEENYIYYVVTFNSMGGSEVASQRVIEDTLLTEPAVPTMKDHKFVGWYLDTSYARKWDFAKDKVTHDCTLFAKWITWSEEQEAEYQDNLKGIYWVKIIKRQEASIASYFVGAAKLKSENKKIAKVNSKKRTVKGKKAGNTLITGTFATEAEAKSVRLFVYNQTISQMSVYNTHTSINAIEHLAYPELLPTSWKSSNPNVASIDPNTGVITVHKRGVTKIQAYYGKTKVTGKLVCAIPEFTKKYIKLVPGQSKKLRIKGVKNYTIVSYNSPSANGRQIAQIDDNGKITGLLAGESTISANVMGEIIACKLFIQQPSLAKTSLSMKLDSKAKVKLKHCKLSVVEWKSSNNGVAFVDPTNGTVYAVGKGSAIIRTNAGGVTNTVSITVTDDTNKTKTKTKTKTK